LPDHGAFRLFVEEESIRNLAEKILCDLQDEIRLLQTQIPCKCMLCLCANEWCLILLLNAQKLYPQGTISLVNCSWKVPEAGDIHCLKKDHCFILRADSKEYYFSSESRTEFDCWKKSLMNTHPVVCVSS
jgi:hypothetical protein